MGDFVMEGLWLRESLFHLPLLIPFHLLVPSSSSTHKDVGLGKLFYASMLFLRGVWLFMAGGFPWGEPLWYILWLSLELSVLIYESNRSFIHLGQRASQACEFFRLVTASMMDMADEFNECQM